MTTQEAINTLDYARRGQYICDADYNEAIDHAILVMKEEGKSISEHIAELSDEDRMELFSKYLNLPDTDEQIKDK